MITTKGNVMKKYIFSIALCIGIIIAVNVNASHAQLLKKLTQKAKKTSGNTNISGITRTAEGSAESNVPFDFAKYNITTQVIVHPSDIKEADHKLQNQYSSYEVNGRTITAKVIFYAAPGNGKGSGYADNMPAYVFDNGKLVQKTKVGRIEKQKATLEAASTKYDYPYADPNGSNIRGPGGMSINFNGKKYGPFMITALTVNKERTKFYAIIDENSSGTDHFYLISSDGGKLTLPAMANMILTNIDYSSAAACNFLNNQNGNDIYFMNGKIAKNASHIVSMGGGWLDPSGKNYLSADENMGAYINGKKIADKGPNAGDVWCNADASKWCYYSDESGDLVFSDGAKIPNIIHPVQIPLNGKTYIVWLQYKNGYDGDLLLCKKTL